MDNQTNNQEPVIETPVSQESIVPETPITPQPEVAESTPPNDYQQVLNEYAANTQTVNPNPVEGSTEQQLQDLSIATPPKSGSGFLKVFFIIALVIFILVVAALVYTYYKSQKNSPVTDNSPSTISSTPTPTGTCFLNDKTYQVGESFASADGCNTCSCQSQDMIVCTEKACASTPATSSANKTPSTFVAPKITPDKITLSFYQEYIKNFPPVYKNSPYLTTSFINSIDEIKSKTIENGGINTDPIIFAQDYPTSFTAKVLTQNTTSATVILTENFTPKQELKISLIIIDGQWKIDSITLNN